MAGGYQVSRCGDCTHVFVSGGLVPDAAVEATVDADVPDSEVVEAASDASLNWAIGVAGSDAVDAGPNVAAPGDFTLEAWVNPTDVSAERYWTVVSEMEVESMEAFMAMMQNTDDAKEFDAIMKGYHDLVDWGRREVYNIEA